MIIYKDDNKKLELKIKNNHDYIIIFQKGRYHEMFSAATYKDHPNKFMILARETEINKLMIESNIFDVTFDSFNNVIYEFTEFGKLKVL